MIRLASKQSQSTHSLICVLVMRLKLAAGALKGHSRDARAVLGSTSNLRTHTSLRMHASPSTAVPFKIDSIQECHGEQVTDSQLPLQ